ncbi:MAG: tetratricopeptide repeat protein [Candidatus Eisenbacteria bacterium]|nr:tetratricopeptide repeat protein [Candidatus Latescibacterota bacterium]MBD3302858.1 tetratricopeptide repeat protein [Candidatus Eisenbacteria bacterium]
MAAQRRTGWIVTGAIVVVVAVALWAGFNHLSKEMLRSELPELPELGRRPPALQEQIREADAAAREDPRSGETVGRLAMIYHANNLTHQAREAYGLAMRIDEDDPRWPYLLGVLEMTIGENERAVTYLKRAAEIDPDYPHVWARLGQIHYRRAETTEAEQALRRALQIEPTHPHAAVDLARVLGLQERWDEAAEVLEPAVRAHPVYGPGHRMLALVYQALGRTRDQEIHEDLGSDVGLQMDDPRVHEMFALSSTGSVLVTQGQIARSWGEMERAHQLFQRAVEVAPRDKDARLALGRFLAAPGVANEQTLQAAREHLETGLALDSTYVNTRHDYAMVLQAQGDTAAAADQWERILREEPGHAMAWMSLGELELSRENYAKAREHFEKGLSIPPDTPFSLGDPAMGYRRLAQTLDKLGEGRQAFDAYSRAVDLNPRIADTYIEWARFLRGTGRAESGVKVYEMGLEAIPEDPRIHLGFGNYLIQLQRFDRAYEELSIAVRGNPNDFRALAALGFAALQTGRTGEAVERLERATELNPRYPLAQFHLANAYRAVGRESDAARRYEMVLQMQPGFTPAREALREMAPNR